MKHIKKFEAMETECQTPDALYHIEINDDELLIS
jgi:hypothetical protein